MYSFKFFINHTIFGFHQNCQRESKKCETSRQEVTETNSIDKEMCETKTVSLNAFVSPPKDTVYKMFSMFDVEKREP